MFLRKGLCFFLFCGVLFSPFSWAAEETAGDYLHGIGIKFGRGLLNVLTSPAEIPCAVDMEREGSKIGGFFSGLGKGTGLMLRRILSGVTEVGTFMIPMEATLSPVCQES